MQFNWKITKVWEKQTSAKGFEKITVVLEENTDKEFKSSIAVDFGWKNLNQVSWLKVWDVIIAHLNFRASEYNGKDYNNVSCWKVEKNNSMFTESTDDSLPF